MIYRVERLTPPIQPQAVGLFDKLVEKDFDEPLVDRSFFEKSVATVSRVRAGSPLKGLYDSNPKEVGHLERLVRGHIPDMSVMDVAVKSADSSIKKSISKAQREQKALPDEKEETQINVASAPQEVTT